MHRIFHYDDDNEDYGFGSMDCGVRAFAWTREKNAIYRIAVFLMQKKNMPGSDV